MLRFILPIPENDLLQINNDGEPEGQMKPLFEGAFFYLVLKFNMTWIPIRSGAKTSDDVAIEGIHMIEQDRADLAQGDPNLFDGLPANVSIGVVNYNGWCKIASSPAVTSSVFTHGPESALKKMNMEFLILLLIGLFAMIYLGHRKSANDGRKSSPLWTLYATLIRKHVHSSLERYSVRVYIVLLIASLLIQILFSSLLHTERASISSFTRIDSFEDVQSHGLRKFVLDLSSCPKVLEKKQELEIISFADAYLSGKNYKWCASSGKCSLLVSPPEAHFLRSFMCSMEPDMTLKSPVYYSPTIAKTVIGHFSNKRTQKTKQNQVNSYIQRASEMGLEHGKGTTSKYFGKQTVKATTQFDVSEKCFANSFRTSISAPAPLNIQFFIKCFILYMLVIFISLILHLHAIIKPPNKFWCRIKSFQ